MLIRLVQFKFAPWAARTLFFFDIKLFLFVKIRNILENNDRKTLWVCFICVCVFYFSFIHFCKKILKTKIWIKTTLNFVFMGHFYFFRYFEPVNLSVRSGLPVTKWIAPLQDWQQVDLLLDPARARYTHPSHSSSTHSHNEKRHLGLIEKSICVW